MSGDFLDSNVLVYAVDQRSPDKRTVARSLVGEALDSHDAEISFQVVQETLTVLTQKLPRPLTTRAASRYMDLILRPLWTIMPSAELYRRALGIQDRYGFHFYDALIVAAALEGECTRLLSEDLQDGQQIEGLTIVNPFAPGFQS